jgi:hypothetical protein
MYPYLCVAPVLALLLGQAEPAEPTAPTPAAEELAPAPQPASPAAEPREPAAKRAPKPAAKPAPSTAEPSAQPATGSSKPAAAAEPERSQIARAALAFLDALVAGDAGALAASTAAKFSFDGEVRSGKEEIQRTWRGLLAGRDAADRPALLDLELLPARDALARLGPPPPRLAQLAATPGAWVAVANVSRRPVVLFLVREGARWTVAGME